MITPPARVARRVRWLYGWVMTTFSFVSLEGVVRKFHEKGLMQSPEIDVTVDPL
jgi:hypothetical protein